MPPPSLPSSETNYFKNRPHAQKWAQNELKDISGGSLSYNSKSGSFMFLFLPYRSFAFGICEIPKCAHMCLHIYTRFLCFFFGSFLLGFIIFQFVCFCLSYCYSLNACLFSNKDRKCMDQDGEKR